MAKARGTTGLENDTIDIPEGCSGDGVEVYWPPLFGTLQRSQRCLGIDIYNFESDVQAQEAVAFQGTW
jgi:hypothetical protein